VRGKMIDATIAATLLATPAFAGSLKIDEIIVGTTIPESQKVAELDSVKAFYQFWNTGDEALLKEAISPNFVDHTLPPGRPQGPTGPAFASEHFRAAVPDLHVEVRKMVFADDYVTVHMVFSGHFTGIFGKIKGQGQVINFVATDLLKIADGKITDNWHIEDNLTLLTQMGVVAAEH
jgi:predicted ester cyclase